MLSKSMTAVLAVCLLSAQSYAGHPVVQKVLLQGHCVTPVQTFASPVYSYSAPHYQQQAIVQSQQVYAQPAQAAAVNQYGDVSQALEIISKFKLQQQVLDDGLTALGYGSPSQVAAAPNVTYSYPQSAPVVNYGLAPFAQGTTQYQVESLQVSSFGHADDAIAENLNALARLADNMQRGSVTVGASVGSSVQSLADAVHSQSSGAVEVAKIQAEAAARIAMLQAASKLVEDTRPSPQFDATLNTVSPETTTEELGEAVTIQSVEPAIQADEASLMLLRDSCYSCHSGEKVKGGWTLDGGLSQEDLVKASASVLSGTMPKSKEKLTVEQRLQVVRALHSLAK